jgi:hypothetical protein
MSLGVLQPVRRARRWAAGSTIALLATLATGAASQEPANSPPVKVTIQDEKPVVVEPVLPIDPVRRIQYNVNGMSVAMRSENNQTLHLSHFPTFSVDGRLYQQGQGGAPRFVNKPLPQDKTRKYREGFTSQTDFGEVRVTATFTLVPTKPAKGSPTRQLDSILTHYLVENRGTKPHKFGLRIYMDTFVIDNDGCLFAAPNFPGKLLDGMILKGKQFPPYLQMLQRPDLKNPGYVSHMSLDLGARLERADRLILTRFGLAGTWDMPAMASMGDSAIGLYWEPKDLRPGGKREYAYAYGKGVVPNLEGEGRVELALGGSFEPGKSFKVMAHVSDPAAGQVLSLELPPGMELVEGKQIQPVPPPLGEEPVSMVVWRARVLRTGDFTVRVHSNTGVTQGKLVTIAR